MTEIVEFATCSTNIGGSNFQRKNLHLTVHRTVFQNTEINNQNEEPLNESFEKSARLTMSIFTIISEHFLFLPVSYNTFDRMSEKMYKHLINLLPIFV